LYAPRRRIKGEEKGSLPAHPVKAGKNRTEETSEEMTERLTTVPFNFGGLPHDQCRWENSRVVFIPVPYDLTSTYLAGSRRGPLAILEASTHMELFDEELDQETYRVGFHTLDSLEATALGPERMIALVEKYVQRVVRAKKFPVLLGGEHSITLGAARALKKKVPRISFLQLDAHADLRASYEGTPFSHACIGRRLAELGPLVQVGIRSLTREENLYIKRGAVKTFFWHRLEEIPHWEEEVLRSLAQEVYVTIDLDVLDPAIMPATGTPEPGGLSWKALTALLRRVAREKTVVGFDAVELTPIPGLVAPDFLAAKLIYRFLGEIFAPALRQGKPFLAVKEN
jgi:agmatinase